MSDNRPLSTNLLSFNRFTDDNAIPRWKIASNGYILLFKSLSRVKDVFVLAKSDAMGFKGNDMF